MEIMRPIVLLGAKGHVAEDDWHPRSSRGEPPTARSHRPCLLASCPRRQGSTDGDTVMDRLQA